jgi:hypothetical protein
MFEQAKMVHALDSAATVIGLDYVTEVKFRYVNTYIRGLE